eukprot:6209789-Pleurochrysis_carterae.AAC.3
MMRTAKCVTHLLTIGQAMCGSTAIRSSGQSYKGATKVSASLVMDAKKIEGKHGSDTREEE